MATRDYSAEFFDFGGWAFLNCAYHGPMPRVAAEALAAAVETRKNPAMLSNEDHFAFPNAYREVIGALIGAPPAEIAVTDSTTSGIMLLVNGLDWRPGDEVVIPDGEFPANRLPWLSLEKRGVAVKVVDLGDGSAAVAKLESAITPRTRVISVSWVTYMNGRRLDLAPISLLCRERRVLFVVDGSQGVGGMPFDLGETPADMVACSGYKWLLGPYGTGFAYVRPELAERLDPGNINWFAAEGAEDFNRLADLPFALRRGGVRFDSNETANFFNLAPATAAARLIHRVTPGEAHAHSRSLQDRLISGLPAGYAPRQLASDGLRSNILCINGPDTETTAEAYRLLLSRRIAVSSREGSIRVSPHLYNSEADIDRLLEVLWEAGGRRRASSAR